MDGITQILLSALVGAGSALAVEGLKGVVSRYFQKLDETKAQREHDYLTLRNVIFETRDLATEYWENPGAAPGQKTRQASIIGRLTFILKIQSDLFDANRALSRKVGEQMDQFYDACSGGEFGSSDRPEQSERCTDVEVAAYSLVHRCQSALRQL
ncbi:hypothetical protein [Roseovarius sp. THAF27]|uniref:hypothetical protein n=1 Tax=Roseovarius sp. THAF27 TaxID=2587850 RepID=UPI001267B60A|nr:hypothetical protein [Roseovarius sp. THAF27]